MESIKSLIPLDLINSPYFLIALGVALVLLIIIIVLIARRSGQKKRAREVAPHFEAMPAQIAPMGRDLCVKIKNVGNSAWMKQVEILGKSNIKITKAFINDFEVESNKVYNIFCESGDRNRIDIGFEVAIHFQDKIGNNYRQNFKINKAKSEAQKAKIVSYA